MSDQADEEQRIPASCWMHLDEIEHRVANEYALAVSSLSLAACQNELAAPAIRHVIEVLNNQAVAHRSVLKPRSDGPVDLAVHLRSICHAMTEACLKPRGISLLLLEEEVLVDPDWAWRVGLIVHELITNAVKHGFARTDDSRILVAISQIDDAILCHFSNSGKAIAPSTVGRGFRIMDALAATMNATLQHSFCETGASAVLRIPR